MFDLEKINSIPIEEVANSFNIDIGRNHTALCFLHEVTKPSLKFNPKDNYWFCFGCSTGGSVIDLVKMRLQLSFVDSCKWLIDSFLGGSGQISKRIIMPKRQEAHSEESILSDYFAPNHEIYEWLIDSLSLSESSRKYLMEKRGYKDQTIKYFNLRDISDPITVLRRAIDQWGEEALIKSGIISKKQNSDKYSLCWYRCTILIPFYDEQDKIVYIQGRNTGEVSKTIKYKNLNNIATNLFNLRVLKEINEGDSLGICEGATDSIMAYQNGYKCLGVIGASGFKKQYVSLLEPFRIFIFPDNDKAGEIFSNKIKNLFSEINKHVYVMSIDDFKDLSEYFLKNPRNGSD